MADVFISYSRQDGEFVRGLHEFLQGAGRDVWVDWEDIPAASAWAQDIDDSIDAAESVVFVVSTHSLASEYCTAEFRHAQERGKRIVPIACDAADPEAAQPGLRQLNWIWCRVGDDRDAAFAKLAGALDTDLEWARTHTRLLVRAVDWEARGDSSLLLRGRDLKQAEEVLAANAAKEPKPTELQQRYVHASRSGASRRQRILLGGVLLALAVSIGLGVAALLQRNTANQRARIARSQALAAQAVGALSSAPAAALADAVKAVETSRTDEAEVALRRAILANPVEYVIPAGPDDRRQVASAGARVDTRATLAFSADGQLLVGLTPAGSLQVWRGADGRPAGQAISATTAVALAPGKLLSADGRSMRLARPDGAVVRTRAVPAGQRVVGVGFVGRSPSAVLAGRGAVAIVDVVSGREVRLHGRAVYAGQAVFSAGGKRVVTVAGGEQGTVRVWETHTGRQLAALRASFPESAAISPDGRFFAAVAPDGAELWSVDRGVRLARLGPAARVIFSPDGRLVVAVGENGGAGVWRSNGGRLVAALPGFGSLHAGALGSFRTPFAPGAAFSPDGRLLALAASDAIVRVWELATRKQVGAVAMGWANTLAFGPNGGRLAAMTWDGHVVVARAPASLALRTAFHPSSCVAQFDPVLSPDGRRVLAPVAGGAGVWDVDGKRLQLLPTPARPAGPADAAAVSAAAFSGDGTTAVVSANSGGCHQSQDQRFWTAVWRVGGHSQLRRFPQALDIALDPHGSLIAAGGKAWRTATGAPVRSLDGIVGLSPDGRLALVRRNWIATIVQVGSGAAVAKLRGFGGFTLSDVSATFSPDGRRLVTLRGGDVLRLWDAASGEPLGRLGRAGEIADGYSFSKDGRLVRVIFEDERAATFSAADGSPVSSLAGRFAAISPDGTLATAARDDGSVVVADLATELSVAVQTDTAESLVSASFGPTPGLLVAADATGDVHLLRCAICGSEAELLTRAREQLALVSRFHPRRPPASGVA